MSFILDALRKSDKRRRVNETPDLAAAPVEAIGRLETGEKRSRRGLLLAAVFLITLAVVAYVQREPIERQWTAWISSTAEQGEGLPDAAQPIVPAGNDDDINENQGIDRLAAYRERADTPRERLVTDPDAARAEIERLVAEQSEGSNENQDGIVIDRRSPTPSRMGQSVSAAAPARVQPAAPDPEVMARVQQRLREAERVLAMDSVASTDPARNSDGEAASQLPPAGPNDTVPVLAESPDDPTAGSSEVTDWTPAAAEYIRAWELPLSIRRNLPALTLNIHVFSELQDERFVLINGERYTDGDELPDGARLVDIRREGAVVDYRDYRFLLEP